MSYDDMKAITVGEADLVETVANLMRWLAADGSAPADLAALEAIGVEALQEGPLFDRLTRGGHLAITATLPSGRVATALLDLQVTYTKRDAGIDLIWPWSWRDA